MENKYGVPLVIGFFVFAALFIFVASRREYKIEGDNVYVKTPQAVTTLKKSGEFEQQVHMIVGEGLNANDYYQTELPAIPMGTVAQLTEKYGDFRECANSGAEAGKDAISHLRLIGINDAISKKIADTYKRSKQREDFVIMVEGANLQILEHKIKSNRARNAINPPHADILVRDIEVVEK